MRTEDDLRTALSSLEQHAPAAARVLLGLSTPRSRSGLRSPKAIGWAAGIATAAALAGALTAVTVTGGTPSTMQNGGVAPSIPVTRATLQAKLLAAFAATGNEILHMHGTFQTTGVPDTDPNPLTEDMWTYPGQPSAGQQVRIRVMTVQPGFGRIDMGRSYLEPPLKDGQPAGAGQTKGEQTYVDYQVRTWSDVKDATVMVDAPHGPALIKSFLKSKKWTARNSTLNGRPAIELTLKSVVLQGKTVVNSSTDYLWVDPKTYLPLHEVETFGPPGQSTHAVEDYQYLPATPANLAELTPPIPAGFKKVTPPPDRSGKLHFGPNQRTASPKPTATAKHVAP